MEGSVLHLDEINKKGILRNDSGDRYEFTENEWESDIEPKVGMAVDFIPEKNMATQIFTLRSTFMSKELLEKVLKLQKSNLIMRITALFSNGMHNKFGFFATLSVLVSLFLPVIEIPFLGKGSFSLIDDGMGDVIFLLLVVLAILFYGGATKLYTQILAGVILGILFFQYYHLFSGLNQVNNLSNSLFGDFSVQWGALVNIVACVILSIAAFKKGYLQNVKAI